MARRPSAYSMVIGPVTLHLPCPTCRADTEHERAYSTVWGEVMARCLRCGREVIDKPIR